MATLQDQATSGAVPASAAGTSPAPTALLVLADGTVLEGFGLGAVGDAPGEVCFNTAMTGYQEILTDPVLCRADRHLHLPAYRQCRHQRGGHRDGQHGRRLGRARRRASTPTITEPVELARDAAISTPG